MSTYQEGLHHLSRRPVKKITFLLQRNILQQPPVRKESFFKSLQKEKSNSSTASSWEGINLQGPSDENESIFKDLKLRRSQSLRHSVEKESIFKDLQLRRSQSLRHSVENESIF
jgi:hypothetical protein